MKKPVLYPHLIDSFSESSLKKMNGLVRLWSVQVVLSVPANGLPHPAPRIYAIIE